MTLHLQQLMLFLMLKYVSLLIRKIQISLQIFVQKILMSLLNNYDIFWKECKKFLAEDISTAVDNRWHRQVTHWTQAISIRDLVDQVSSCPEGIGIPSLEWVCLQFWPKAPSARVSLHYAGQFQVNFMIQQCQWCCQHPDVHYAATTFRFIR